MKTKNIPIEYFGKDHWSTFVYVETLAVESVSTEGVAVPDGRKMRSNLRTHPFSSNHHDCSEKYPPIIKDGKEVPSHDDWDCLDDCIAAGLLLDVGTGTNRAYKLTDYGFVVIHQLREHKAKGGKFADFTIQKVQ